MRNKFGTINKKLYISITVISLICLILGLVMFNWYKKRDSTDNS